MSAARELTETTKIERDTASASSHADPTPCPPRPAAPPGLYTQTPAASAGEPPQGGGGAAS
eukprot:9722406-Alexandrium_andersonii.AAC.1